MEWSTGWNAFERECSLTENTLENHDVTQNTQDQFCKTKCIAVKLGIYSETNGWNVEKTVEEVTYNIWPPINLMDSRQIVLDCIEKVQTEQDPCIKISKVFQCSNKNIAIFQKERYEEMQKEREKSRIMRLCYERLQSITEGDCLEKCLAENLGHYSEFDGFDVEKMLKYHFTPVQSVDNSNKRNIISNCIGRINQGEGHCQRIITVNKCIRDFKEHPLDKRWIEFLYYNCAKKITYFNFYYRFNSED